MIVFASNTWTYSEVIEYQIDLYHAYGILTGHCSTKILIIKQ